MRSDGILLVSCLAAALVGGCKRDQAAGPGGQGTGGLQEVGRCETVSVDNASCVVRDVVVTTEVPGQPGAKVVRVSHVAKIAGRAIGFDSYRLVVPEARIKELEAFFKKHSPVGCDGEIIRPPCNPDSSTVALKLTLPDYTKPHR